MQLLRNKLHFFYLWVKRFLNWMLSDAAWKYVVLGSVFIVTGIYALFFILSYQSVIAEGFEYSPLNVNGFFDELNVTIPRVRDVIDGRFIVGEIDAYEHMNARPFLPIFPPLLLSIPSFFTDSINLVMVYSYVLYVGLSVYLLFVMAMILFKGDRFFSLFFVYIFSLFPKFILYFPPTSRLQFIDLVKNFLPFQYGDGRSRLSLLHMESVVPDWVVFLPCVIFSFLAVTQRKPRWYILTGLFLGLLFYTYPFYWMYIGVSGGLILLFSVYKKDWFSVRWLIISMCIAFLVGFYYFYNLIVLHSLPVYSTLADSIWIERSRMFRVSHWFHYVKILALTGIVWRITRLKNVYVGHWFVAFLMSGIVVLNYQVLTGFSLAPIHWLPRTNYFFMTLAFMYIVHWFLGYVRIHNYRFFKIFSITMFVLVMFQVSGSIHSQIVYAQNSTGISHVDDDFMTTLEWIDDTIDADDVLLSPQLSLNYYYPVYTSARLFLVRAVNTQASAEERLERFVIAGRFFGFSDDYLKQLLNSEANNALRSKRGTELLDNMGLHYFFSGAAMSNGLDEYLDAYYFFREDYNIKFEELLLQYPVFTTDMFRDYRLDYVVLNEESFNILGLDLTDYDFLELVYDKGGYFVFKINHILLEGDVLEAVEVTQ